MGGGGVESVRRRSRSQSGFELEPPRSSPPPLQPGPAESPIGLDLTEDFRELDTRGSRWKGEGFVLGLGRVCEKLRDEQEEVGREELGLYRRPSTERPQVTPGKPPWLEGSRVPA